VGIHTVLPNQVAKATDALSTMEREGGKGISEGSRATCGGARPVWIGSNPCRLKHPGLAVFYGLCFHEMALMLIQEFLPDSAEAFVCRQVGRRVTRA
jgi:hypothetical protein